MESSIEKQDRNIQERRIMEISIAAAQPLKNLGCVLTVSGLLCMGLLSAEFFHRDSNDFLTDPIASRIESVPKIASKMAIDIINQTNLENPNAIHSYTFMMGNKVILVEQNEAAMIDAIRNDITIADGRFISVGASRMFVDSDLQASIQSNLAQLGIYEPIGSNITLNTEGYLVPHQNYPREGLVNWITSIQKTAVITNVHGEFIAYLGFSDGPASNLYYFGALDTSINLEDLNDVEWFEHAITFLTPNQITHTLYPIEVPVNKRNPESQNETDAIKQILQWLF